MKSLMIAAAAALAFTSAAAAAPINASNAGLTGAEVTIDFEALGLPAGGTLTDQLKDEGVIFAPGVNISTGNPQRENFDGDFALNFGNGFANPLTIDFTSVVSDVSISITSNFRPNAIFSAFLDGLLVESFVGKLADGRKNDAFLGVTPTRTDPNNVFGFTGILFDQLVIDIQSNLPFAALDNLAFNTADPAPVPLPAGLPLLLAGLGAFGLLRRKTS